MSLYLKLGLEFIFLVLFFQIACQIEYVEYDITLYKSKGISKYIHLCQANNWKAEKSKKGKSSKKSKNKKQEDQSSESDSADALMITKKNKKDDESTILFQ